MSSTDDVVLAALDDDGNPSVVDRAVPLIRADDLAVLRGEGVFETTRAFAGQSFLLQEHLERMRASAARIDLQLPEPAHLEALAACALDAFGPADAGLRLVVTKGPENGGGRAFALVSPVSEATIRARADGVAALTLTLGMPASLRPRAPWLLGGVKSTSYATAMAALRVTGERESEAIYLSGDGEVLEAPTASVVAVVEGVAVTPPPAAVGILPGTTVDFFGDEVVHRPLLTDELRAAPEILLLSSVRGVVPVVSLDGTPVGGGRPGPVGRAMARAYEDAVAALSR
jgi:4-amino-4-deoxychorismate lyase